MQAEVQVWFALSVERSLMSSLAPCQAQPNILAMEQWNMKILDPTGRSSSMQCQTATTVGGTSSFHCRPRLSLVDVGGTCLMLPKAYLLHPMLWTCSRESRETAEVRRIMPGQQLPTGRAEPLFHVQGCVIKSLAIHVPYLLP